MAFENLGYFSNSCFPLRPSSWHKYLKCKETPKGTCINCFFIIYLLIFTVCIPLYLKAIEKEMLYFKSNCKIFIFSKIFPIGNPYPVKAPVLYMPSSLQICYFFGKQYFVSVIINFKVLISQFHRVKEHLVLSSKINIEVST